MLDATARRRACAALGLAWAAGAVEAQYATSAMSLPSGVLTVPVPITEPYSTSLTTSNLWCYNYYALASHERPYIKYASNTSLHSLLQDSWVSIVISIGLAGMVILIMVMAVCIRDRREGKKEPETAELPLKVLSSATFDRKTASRDSRSRRFRFPRAPRRISRALRKRRITRVGSAMRRASIEEPIEPDLEQGASEQESVSDAAQAAAPIVGLPLPELGPRVGDEGQASSLPPTPPAPVPWSVPGHAAPSAYQTPPVPPTPPGPSQAPRVDRSDLEAVDALHVDHDIAQPPAYIAAHHPQHTGKGKERAHAEDEAEGTDELFAHVATDDKAVLTALRTAASAPTSAASTERQPGAPPGTLFPSPDTAPSAPPMDEPLPPDSVAAVSSRPAPPQSPAADRGVSVYDASLQGKPPDVHAMPLLPPPPPPVVARRSAYDAQTYELPPAAHNTKEAEAAAERAQLASLLPSAPDEWAWHETLPVYGATAPQGDILPGPAEAGWAGTLDPAGCATPRASVPPPSAPPATTPPATTPPPSTPAAPHTDPARFPHTHDPYAP